MVYRQNKKTTAEFEVEFYEKLVEDKPDYVDALIPLAEAYTKAGLFQKGLKTDKKLAQFKPDDAIVHYNLACSYSLTEDIAKAFDALKAAINLGYSDFKYMDADPDLAVLRKDQRYKKIISNVVREKGNKKWNG